MRKSESRKSIFRVAEPAKRSLRNNPRIGVRFQFTRCRRPSWSCPQKDGARQKTQAALNCGDLWLFLRPYSRSTPSTPHPRFWRSLRRLMSSRVLGGCWVLWRLSGCWRCGGWPPSKAWRLRHASRADLLKKATWSSTTSGEAPGMWHLASESAIWFGDHQSRYGGSWRRRLDDSRGGKQAVLFAVSIWSLNSCFACARPVTSASQATCRTGRSLSFAPR